MAPSPDVPVTAAALRDLLRQGGWVRAEAEGSAALAASEDADGELGAVVARARFRLGLPDPCAAAARAALRRAGDAASWRVRLAWAESRLAQGEPGEARALLQALLDEVHDDPEATHDLRLALSVTLRAQGEASRGYALACTTLAAAEVAEDALATEEALAVVGHTAWAADRPREAEEAFSRLHTLRAARVAPPALLAEAHDGLGHVLRRREPFEAVTHHRAALRAWEEATGPDSGPVSHCLHQLAQAEHHTGDFQAARDTMARALLTTAATLGHDHIDTWITRFEMARYDVDCGEMEDGFVRMERARAEVARRLGPQHPVVRAMDRYL